MQLELAKVETMLWKTLREGRECAKKLQQLKLQQKLTETDEKSLGNLENHIFINEQLVRISRTICDGIAWRNLKYNRTFLNSSARGFGAGDVDINNESFKSEFDWAYRISEAFDSVVLLNDLTHFLRVGDLTEISDKGIFIHEIKKLGKKIINLFTLKKLKESGEISDQSKRLLELQRIALSESAIIGDIHVRTERLNVELKTNFDKLSQLLEKSENELVVSELIEPCLTLHITNFHAISLAGNTVNIDNLKSKLVYPSKKGLLLPQSNWDTFYSDEKGNFLRSAVPYSVYPLFEKHCIKLISGHYLVNCILDVEKLKEILQVHGWIVEEITEKELDQQLAIYESAEKTIFLKKNSIYNFAPNEIGILKIKRGAFSLNLTPTFYSRFTMEFMKLETFLEMMEEMYLIASIKKKSDLYFPTLKNDFNIWN